MSEPLPLQNMDADERQLLKEAVCDAILERTRRVVSGDGPLGATIVGAKPSRTLSSGFILPRIGEDGDDESSDIRIAAHGLDLRLRGTEGTFRVAPRFSIYVRVFATAEELFARNGRLLPRAELSTEANRRAKAEINERANDELRNLTTSALRAQARARIAAEVYASMGVIIPEGAQLPGGDERDLDPSEPLPPPPTIGRLRIPNSLARQYEAPQKWHRVDVHPAVLELPLPCNPARWNELALAYSRSLLEAIRSAYLGFISSDVGQMRVWRRRRPQSEDFWTAEAWDDFLERARQEPPAIADLIPNFDVQLVAQALADPTAPGCYSVRISLENNRESDADLECGLFNVSLELHLPDDALVPMRLERVRRSYHLAGFMSMPAIGVNGGTEDLGAYQGVRRLRTTWMPRYVLPRMRARQIDEVPTSYEQLSQTDLTLERLSALTDVMAAWRQEVEQTTDLSLTPDEGDASDEHRQREQFARDLQAWETEARRISLGIDLLLRSRAAWTSEPSSLEAIPYRAWIYLNQTMARANPRRRQEPAPGWRLFQLGFILAHLPTLASRMEEYADFFRADFDEDSASLLYMSTGGGKTEAFFGTVIFAMFLDRLRGKARGVTAMMHYPLRLLTVQQAQRLARLVAHAEMIRRANSVGGAPFEIGFWVGGGNTPNRTEMREGVLLEELRPIPRWDEARARDELALLTSDLPDDRAYAAANAAWNKLPKCPFCGFEERTALRIFPEEHNRLGIICRNPECDWNIANAGGPYPPPLPFLLVDTDIYMHAPAVLLGTVDKLALLGQSPPTIDKLAGMFGLARVVEDCPLGLLLAKDREQLRDIGSGRLQAVAPAYQDGLEVFHDPFPSLIVQDEMHLLEESLGTFGGIFETGLFTWLTRIASLLGERFARVPATTDRPRLPHVIGATATVSDAAKHTRALYQRRVHQFPHPGPALHSGFYTGLADFSAGSPAQRERSGAPSTPRGREGAAPWARVHASIMTNGRLHTVTTISVLAAHAATITRWQRDLSSGDSVLQNRAATEIESCISDAPYSEGRRSAVRAAQQHIDRLAALVDLHRIELTYVTNKKGGDQILAALRGEVDEAHNEMGAQYLPSDFSMRLISGGVDIAGIQEVIRAAEEHFDPMSDDISSALRIIVATSAISHGVDVEAFNAMAFAGMPADIAEYIQASSRVGRTHVGFSLLIPTPQTRRDRFVVEVHESFHRLLERMIAPPAVERWADRAIARTIPSLVQTWLVGVHFQSRFVATPTSSKGSVPVPATVEHLNQVLSSPALLNECAQFIQEAIGIEGVEGRPTNPAYYSNLVLEELRRIHTTAASGQFTGALRDFWGNPFSGLPRPMLSLRDVDASGVIRASRRTPQSRPVDLETMEAAMVFLRNRGGSRRTAASEIDEEA